MPTFEDPLWSTKSVSEYLNIHPQSLARWRKNRTGPPYVRLEGGIFYRRSELEEWIEKNKIQPEG